MARVIKTISANLEANARYAIRIRSINSLGVSSDWSEALDLVTADDSTVPPAPGNVTATPGLRSIILKWDPVSITDLSHYEIYIRQTSGDFVPVAQEMIARPAGNNTQLISRFWNGSIFTDLVPGTTYTIKMRAVDVANNAGSYSVSAPVTVGFLQDSDVLTLNPAKFASGTAPNNYNFSGLVTLSGAQAMSGIATLSGSMLFAGSGAITTAASASRATISTSGLQIYATNGTTILFDFDPGTGSITYRTADTDVSRIEIATTAADSIQFFPDGVGADPHLISTSTGTNFVGTHHDIVLASLPGGTSNVESAITLGNYADLANPVGWVHIKTERQIGVSSHLNYEFVMGWGAIFYKNDESTFASGTLMPFSGFTTSYFFKDALGIIPPQVVEQSSEYPSHSYFMQAGNITVTIEDGTADVILPRSFPNGILTICASNIDSSTAKSKYVIQVNSDAATNTKSIFNVRVYDTNLNIDAVDGTTLRISFIVVGW